MRTGTVFQKPLQYLYSKTWIAIIVVFFIATNPATAGELSPEMMALLGQVSDKNIFAKADSGRACEPDIKSRAALTIKQHMASFIFQKVVVDPLEQGGVKALKAVFPEGVVAGFAWDRLSDTYSVYDCYLNSSDSNSFSACLRKQIEPYLVDYLSGKTAKKGIDAIKGLTNESRKELVEKALGDGLKKAYEKISTAGSKYQSKSEVWDSTSGAPGWIARATGSLFNERKVCAHSSVHAEWRKKPTQQLGGKGGILLLVVRFEGCECGTSATAKNGTYRVFIPVKYVKHGNNKPGFELNFNVRRKEVLFGECCGSRIVKRGFCETPQHPDWMFQTACKNTCRRPNECVKTGGFAGNDQNHGLACYACKKKGGGGGDLPPEPEDQPSEPEDISTPSTPAISLVEQEKGITCPPCAAIQNKIDAAKEKLAVAANALQQQQAELVNKVTERENIEKEIERLEEELESTKGIGGSSYDPASDTTTSSFDRGDGMIEIIVRGGRGNGGRVLSKRIRPGVSLATIKAELNEKKAALKQVISQIEAVKQEITAIEERIAKLIASIKQLASDLNACTLFYCHRPDNSGGEIDVKIIQVISQGGNNPFDPVSPIRDGNTISSVNTVGGGTPVVGAPAVGFDFNLITTPPSFFGTSIAGASGTCGVDTTTITFAGSILSLSPFYGNNGNGVVPFAVIGNIATSASNNLTILGAPGHTCTLTPSNANTFFVKCTNNASGATCDDTWARF